MEVIHRPSLSSVSLQVALHFNALFSILFAVLFGATATEKAIGYHRYIPIAAVGFWTVIEPVRLYYGISGNLKEKVSSSIKS